MQNCCLYPLRPNTPAHTGLDTNQAMEFYFRPHPHNIRTSLHNHITSPFEYSTLPVQETHLCRFASLLAKCCGQLFAHAFLEVMTLHPLCKKGSLVCAVAARPLSILVGSCISAVYSGTSVCKPLHSMGFPEQHSMTLIRKYYLV